MINKIDGVSNVKNYSALNFKADTNKVTQQIEEKEFDAKPLANYAKASIDLKNKLKVEPLIPTIYLPEAVDAIKGERVYGSNGDLYAIIDETEKTRTVFTPVEGRDDMFESIVTTDKKTGKIIREQFNRIEGREHKSISIHQFSPETGEEVAYTRYGEDGLEQASKTIYNKNGSSTEICYDYNEKEYRICESSKSGNKRNYVNMSEDMKFMTVESTYESNFNRTNSVAQFYNGALLNAEKYTSNVMPNMMGLDPLKDEDLVPEEILSKSELQKLAEALDGEKTYFSNGAVETVKGKIDDLEVVAKFNPSGEVMELSSEKGDYKVNNYNVMCTTILDENNKKITGDFDKGGKSVTIEKDGKFKEAYYSEKGKITSYYEGEIEKDGKHDCKLSLYYNEKGMLSGAYNF